MESVVRTPSLCIPFAFAVISIPLPATFTTACSSSFCLLPLLLCRLLISAPVTFSSHHDIANSSFLLVVLNRRD